MSITGPFSRGFDMSYVEFRASHRSSREMLMRVLAKRKIDSRCRERCRVVAIPTLKVRHVEIGVDSTALNAVRTVRNFMGHGLEFGI